MNNRYDNNSIACAAIYPTRWLTFYSVSMVSSTTSGGRDFCELGGSGCWVVDETGTLVGLLWGKVDDRELVTDIAVVSANIEVKSGKWIGLSYHQYHDAQSSFSNA